MLPTTVLSSALAAAPFSVPSVIPKMTAPLAAPPSTPVMSPTALVCAICNGHGFRSDRKTTDFRRSASPAPNPLGDVNSPTERWFTNNSVMRDQRCSPDKRGARQTSRQNGLTTHQAKAHIMFTKLKLQVTFSSDTQKDAKPHGKSEAGRPKPYDRC